MKTLNNGNSISDFQRCSIQQPANTKFHYVLERNRCFLTALLWSETLVRFALQQIHFCSNWKFNLGEVRKDIRHHLKDHHLESSFPFDVFAYWKISAWFILPIDVFHQAIIQFFIFQLKVNASPYLADNKYLFSLFFNSFQKADPNFFPCETDIRASRHPQCNFQTNS